MTELGVVEGVDLSRLHPRPKHILVRWRKRVETKGGVLMPENRQRAGIMSGEVVLVGPNCHEAVLPGVEVQFDGLCEKEFLGPQVPGDRDPMFFMRVEDVFGVINRGERVSIQPINGFVLVEPDRPEVEKAGVLIVSKRDEVEDSRVQTGRVTASSNGVQVGDRVVYRRSVAHELKLGDFEGQFRHVVPSKAIEAVLEEAV